MAQPVRVLVVDDDPDFCEALRDRLAAWGCHGGQVRSPARHESLDPAPRGA